MGLLSRLFGKKTSSPRHAGHNMISLVALASTWRKRSVDEIRQDLDETFPGEFLPPRSEGNFVIEGPAEGASYCVQCTIPNYTGMFLIHKVPRQYSAFSDYLQHIKFLLLGGTFHFDLYVFSFSILHKTGVGGLHQWRMLLLFQFIKKKHVKLG
jgi:hypothetical protein